MKKKSCKCKCSKKSRITHAVKEAEEKAGSTSGARGDKSTASEARGDKSTTSGAGGDKSTTSGAGGDKSNTRTATRTATSTEAYTQGNVTVTGGAGAGATSVYIGCQPPSEKGTAGTSKVGSKTGKNLLGKDIKKLSKSKHLI